MSEQKQRGSLIGTQATTSILGLRAVCGFENFHKAKTVWPFATQDVVSSLLEEINTYRLLGKIARAIRNLRWRIGRAAGRN